DGERMVDVAPTGHRGRGTGTGDLHGSPRFPDGIRGEPRKAAAALRRRRGVRCAASGRAGGANAMSREVALSSDDLAPFFGPAYAPLAARLKSTALEPLAAEGDAARSARAMGALGLYAHLVPEAHGGAPSGRPDLAAYVDV